MEARALRNKKAFHNYHILDTFEAGVALKGTEVKSLRAGNANIADSFAKIEDDEVFLYNMYIAPYEEGGIFNLAPTRKRKLLLHRSEIKKIFGKLALKGLTLIPLKVYFNKRGSAKIELGVAKPKKLFDKRRELREKAQVREIRKAAKRR